MEKEESKDPGVNGDEEIKKVQEELRSKVKIDKDNATQIIIDG
jgi:superfamily II DNA/RNA helicase